MTDPRDTASTFESIAAEVEPLLVRLGRAAPGAELETMRDEITAILDGAGLRWSDVAARVAAPSPAKPRSGYAPPPPLPVQSPPVQPAAEVLTDEERLERFIEKHAGGITAATVLTDEELQAFGYRSHGTPIPGADDPKPAG